MASDEKSGWIRPAFKFEEFMEVAHQYGVMITCYCVTLNSAAPLREYHVKRALLHLHRKIPTLRVTMRAKEGGEMRLHWMEHENLDFQILCNADFQKEYDAMTVYHYNVKDGPLWCTRLLPLPIETPCPISELKEKFPHQYELLFGFHHSITDGSSSMRICSFFIDILNDVIAGRPINDLEQLAYHATDEQTVKQTLEVGMNLMNNPGEMKKVKLAINPDVDVLFTKAYPPPENVKPKTLNLPYSLNKEETSIFLKKCKDEGVSLHSGFFSVVNAAIVEMLTKAGIEREFFDIPNYHTTNNRRYWEGDTTTAFGVHLGKLTVISKVDKNIINEFWDHARSYHSQFHGQLQEKGPLKEAFVMMSLIPPEANIEKIMKMMPPNSTYYGTTNMGNLGSIFTGEGEHVQATNIRRTTSTAKNLCSHVLQTFRGRLLYGLDYDAASMSRETAQLYVETIFKILRTVMKS